MRPGRPPDRFGGATSVRTHLARARERPLRVLMADVAAVHYLAPCRFPHPSHDGRLGLCMVMHHLWQDTEAHAEDWTAEFTAAMLNTQRKAGRLVGSAGSREKSRHRREHLRT